MNKINCDEAHGIITDAMSTLMWMERRMPRHYQETQVVKNVPKLVAQLQSLIPVWDIEKTSKPGPMTLEEEVEDIQRQLGELWGMVGGTAPSGTEDETLDPDALPVSDRVELYYLQDSRSYVGNDMLFWCPKGLGYTTDLRKAATFTREEAQAKHNRRATDIPWRKEYIDARTRPACDMQYVNRNEAGLWQGEK